MADFTDIIQEINTNLPDNNTQSITAKKLRTTLIDLTEKIDDVQDDFETNIQNEFETLSENLNFESGQNIGNVDIVDNLTTKSSDDVLSANQGNILGLRTKEANITETEITEYTINNGHIVSNGSINVQSTPTDTKYAEIQLTEGENRHLRFRGLTYSSSAQIGYCFYTIVDGVEKIIKGASFTVTGTNGNQEYNIAVPAGATIFKTTVKRLTNNIENSFYCYLQTGKTLGDTPTFATLGSSFDTPNSKTLTLIFGYLQKSGITVSNYLPFTSENAYWNCTTHQQVSNTSATSNCLSTTDVSGYDYIMFIGARIAGSSTNYGYAFFKEDNTLIYDKAFDVDPSAASSVPTPYYVQVPPEAKWFKSRNSSQYYNVVGLNGTTIKEDVFDWIDGIYLDKDSLDDWAETVVSSKNLINANDLLEGWTVAAGEFVERENSNMSNKLHLQNGQTYTVQNIYLYSSTPKSIALARFDENDNYLGRNLYYVTSDSQWSGSVASVISFNYVSNGEAYTRLALNYSGVPSTASLSTATMLEVGSEASPWEPYETTEVYDIAKESDLEALEERVETIEDTLDTTGKLMTVTIADTYFYVRSKHSDTEDILINFAQKNNTSGYNLQSTTLNTVYIGPNTSTDAQLKSSDYLISNPSDSIGAIGINSFWYLYAQHGWSIARGSNGGQVDSTDVGSIWKDQNNKLFYLSYVSGSYVYWVPVCTQDEETGVWTASWNGITTTGNYPTSFTYVSGTATHTASFSMSTSRYDVRVQTQTKEYVVDGKTVGNGTYRCNDFTFNEYVLGHNPATVDPTQWLRTGWNNDDRYNGELINWSRCFDFKCGSFKYMCSMNVVNPFKLDLLYGVIPQMPLQRGDYHSYSFIPKVKKLYSGNMICKPFLSDSGIENISASKNTVFDSTDLPDRVVTYLKNDSNQYRCVEAAGFVLNEGIAQKTIRNTNLANMSSSSYIMTYGTGDSTKNKLYVWLLDDTTYPNAIVENTVALNYSGFFSFTNQNIQAENVFVNWYKDNDGYVIYVHGQQAYNKVEIILPEFMNGYKLDSIIEKTGNSDVLTDVVLLNRMYVKLPSQTYYETENFDANYIVFRIK